MEYNEYISDIIRGNAIYAIYIFSNLKTPADKNIIKRNRHLWNIHVVPRNRQNTTRWNSEQHFLFPFAISLGTDWKSSPFCNIRQLTICEWYPGWVGPFSLQPFWSTKILWDKRIYETSNDGIQVEMNSGFRFVCPNKNRGKQIKNMKMRESFRFFLNIYSREFRWRNSKKKQVKYDKKVSLSEPQVRMSRTIQ